MERQTRVINQERDRSSELQRNAHTLSIRIQKESSSEAVRAKQHPLPLSLRLSEKKLYASAYKPPPLDMHHRVDLIKYLHLA